MSTELDKAREALEAADKYTTARPPGAMSGVVERHHLRAALTEVDRLTAALAEAEATIANERAQVAELQRLGASIHKAADAARKAERADVVAWLRNHAAGMVLVNQHDNVRLRGNCYLNTANVVERGDHEGAATKEQG